MSEDKDVIEIDGVNYTGGDIENLKAGHDANIEKKELIAQKEKELESTKEKLTKLENKDFNFRKLEDMTQEQQNKLSDNEKALMKKQEELEENQTKFAETIEESNKKEALAVLAGNDEKLRKKVLYNYNRIKGEAITKEDINKKMRDAFNMLGQTDNAINPINQAVNYQSGGSGIRDVKATKVDSELAQNFGVTDEELKNNKLKT